MSNFSVCFSSPPNCAFCKTPFFHHLKDFNPIFKLCFHKAFFPFNAHTSKNVIIRLFHLFFVYQSPFCSEDNPLLAITTLELPPSLFREINLTLQEDKSHLGRQSKNFSVEDGAAHDLFSY